jgi:hypothetical protein
LVRTFLGVLPDDEILLSSSNCRAAQAIVRLAPGRNPRRLRGSALTTSFARLRLTPAIAVMIAGMFGQVEGQRPERGVARLLGTSVGGSGAGGQRGVAPLALASAGTAAQAGAAGDNGAAG